MIEMRRMCQCPGIVCTTGIESKTVKYGEQNGPRLHAASIITLTGLADNGATCFPGIMISTLIVNLADYTFQRRRMSTPGNHDPL